MTNSVRLPQKVFSEIFDLEYNDVLDDTKQQSHYVVVKRRIESDEREKVLELIDTLKKGLQLFGCYSAA